MVPPSVDRLRRVWLSQSGNAVGQALLGLLVLAVFGGAHVARLGTPLARAAVATVILGVLVWQIVVSIRQPRKWKSAGYALRTVLFATDPTVGARAERALSLVLRTQTDPSFGSHELAEFHLKKLVDGVSDGAIQAAARKDAQRLRAMAIGLLSLATVAVCLGPVHVLEGLDVLFARNGRAPLPSSLLLYPKIAAEPPSYTRESERTFVFGSDVIVPKGTVVTVRAIARFSDHKLVLTDGSREEPFVSDGSGGIVARFAVKGDATLRAASIFGQVRLDDEDQLGVSVLPDQAPRVQLEGAPSTVRLTEMEKLELRWAAQDDYGLRQVDLVLRSGAREERRVLGRFDGESRVERGAHGLSARDAFLRRMFLPVEITIAARDNDPIDGPKWTKSEALTVIPPDVGQPEVERYRALEGIRNRLLGTLATGENGPNVEAFESHLTALVADAPEILSKSYSGVTFPAGLGMYVRSAITELQKTTKKDRTHDVEELALALDVALSAIGNRDAAEVSKRLGDVAEEAALSARMARETERRKASLADLDVALAALDSGALNLVALSALGRDLGGVAQGDTGRIRQARKNDDMLHAELAALHLAARLRRPNPSFGSTTGHGRGTESGGGHGRGSESGLPPPSSAGEEFDRLSQAIEELAKEHESVLRGVESALKEADSGAQNEADQKEARRLAEEVRRAVEPLPLPGEEFGSPRSTAALGREHGKAAAHALDDLSLRDARESADSAIAALSQAEQHLSPGDSLREDLQDAQKILRQARDFAEQALERKQRAAEAQAKHALEQAADTERALGGHAKELAERKSTRGPRLPEELTERLGRASGVMREAARELSEGHGERALALQREAQRLLEQSDRSNEGEKGDKKEDDSDQGRAERESSKDEHGQGIAIKGDVPKKDEGRAAEEFRRRVIEGLSKEKSERLSPAVRRYAEGLLK